MTATDTALTVDWLAVCRRAVEGLQQVLADSPTTAERVRETGTRGSGGDRTLLLDAAAEDVVFEQLDGLAQTAHRIRALGAVAITLCEVAAARMDGMVTLIRSRGVDAAAGQLIVREAGGLVSFPDCPDPLGAPLDSNPSSRLVAARTEQGLRELEQVVTR